MLSSSTGSTVPTIFGSMVPPLEPKPTYRRPMYQQTGPLPGLSLTREVNVLERAPVSGPAARCTRAGITNSDHEHSSARGLEVVTFFEVALEVGDQLLLDVQHTSAELTHGVMVVGGGEFVVRRPLPEMRGIDGTGRRERLQRSIYGAAWKSRPGLVKLGRDLVSGAVTAQPQDGVVHHRPLGRAAHARGRHQWTVTVGWGPGRRPEGRRPRRPVRRRGWRNDEPINRWVRRRAGARNARIRARRAPGSLGRRMVLIRLLRSTRLTGGAQEASSC